MKTGGLLAWGCLVAASGCGGSINAARQDSLDIRISKDERRAAELRADTLRLAALQRLQHRCIEVSACRAAAARVTATATGYLAKCNAKRANWEACSAQRTKNTAGGTALGCGLGWVTAVVTGGAGAPAIAIGCGTGAVVGHSSSSGPCVGTPHPEPCGLRGAEFTSRALLANHLTAMPDCPTEPPECARLESLSRSF